MGDESGTRGEVEGGGRGGSSARRYDGEK